jgi:signal transduction histidine kinase
MKRNRNKSELLHSRQETANTIQLARYRTRPQTAFTLVSFFREFFQHDPEPTDLVYKQRYSAELVDGFKVLSLLVFATMVFLFLVHLPQMEGPTQPFPDALSVMTCAVLTVAGGVGLLTSRFIRSPATAVAASAALLVFCVAAFTIDRLRQTAQGDRPAPSLIPIVSFVLILAVAVIPLRPARVLGLGILLLTSCALAARFGEVPLQANPLDFVTAGTSVAVSVIVAARATSQRIRVHQAHLSAINAEREVEDTRERALLAESAVTMERLAASLSHELNTPIGALKSATETLTLCVQKYASFAAGSRLPHMVQELSTAVRDSTARLSETVGRIQRFANLDRGAIRLIDINELVQDAVALMNPPSMSQVQVALNLAPLPQIWCRPHGLSIALASILNEFLENGMAVTIETYATGDKVVVKLAEAGAADVSEERGQGELRFAVVSGHVRASGWELFAARQLVRETGGDLQIQRNSPDAQTITITLSASAILPGQSARNGTES